MSLPAMHPAKRRRLDHSTSTLSKPFRSPLRVAVKSHSQTCSSLDRSQEHLDNNDNSSREDDSENSFPSENPIPTPCSQHSTSSPIRKPPPPNPPLFHSSPTRTSSSSLSLISKPNSKDPDYLTLQRHHTRLLNEPSALRRSIDTTQQALKIESSSSTNELEVLILKWRTISRDAAEDLFRGAKDRVNRMGGLGAWRDRTRKRDEAWGGQQIGSSGWATDEEIDEDELSQEQKEQLEMYKDEMEKEKDRYADVQTNEKEPLKPPEKDDDSFTMDIMLKQLNIELDLVGYDAEGQRWLD